MEKTLKELEEAVNEIVAIYNKKHDLKIIIYNEWNLKDVLGHLTSWHEIFANILYNTIQNRSKPLVGSIEEISNKGIIDMKNYGINDLLKKLLLAQSLIEENIDNTSVESIQIRKDGKKFTSIEFLEFLLDHAKIHIQDLKKVF